MKLSLMVGVGTFVFTTLLSVTSDKFQEFLIAVAVYSYLFIGEIFGIL